jgi:hypothetical protein
MFLCFLLLYIGFILSALHVLVRVISSWALHLSVVPRYCIPHPLLFLFLYLFIVIVFQFLSFGVPVLYLTYLCSFVSWPCTWLLYHRIALGCDFLPPPIVFVLYLFIIYFTFVPFSFSHFGHIDAFLSPLPAPGSNFSCKKILTTTHPLASFQLNEPYWLAPYNPELITTQLFSI